MKLEIRKLGHTEKAPMDLLLEADPSEEMIEKYLYTSECYVAEIGDDVIGVIVVAPNTAHEIELKNICVAEKYRNIGIGKDLVKYFVRLAKMEGYKDLIVKTADVSKRAIKFYEKMKFEYFFTVKSHFIKYYEEPIMEDGQQAEDQIVMKRSL
ncbi:MAG: GNAT family N-acetyltransferase [Cyclobacteriaceae bacterium]